MQLKDILKPKDIVIAISCSGNSQNIIKACKYTDEVMIDLTELKYFLFIYFFLWSIIFFIYVKLCVKVYHLNTLYTANPA